VREYGPAVAAIEWAIRRAANFCAPVDGRALADGELAYAAHVSAQKPSIAIHGQLGKLARRADRVATPRPTRYYRLAAPTHVGHLEAS